MLVDRFPVVSVEYYDDGAFGLVLHTRAGGGVYLGWDEDDLARFFEAGGLGEFSRLYREAYGEDFRW